MKILFLSKKDDLLFRDNMLAIAMQTAIDYPYISLILSTGDNKADYEKCFYSKERLVREKNCYDRPGAFEYLINREKEGQMTQLDVERVFVPVVDNHLYYLPEDKNVEEKQNEITDADRAKLVNKLDTYADIVYVNAINEKGIIKSFLAESADVVIFGIDSHMSNCDEILLLPAKIREKSLFLLNGYEACSYSNMTMLTRYYRIDEERILTIPSNSIFAQASWKGKGEEFIKRSNFSNMTKGCKLFISQLKRSVNIMVDSLDF